MKTWNVKKTLCLVATIVFLVGLLLPLPLPVFQIYYTVGEASYRYNGNVVDFYSHGFSSPQISMTIGLGLGAILLPIALVHFVKSIRAPSDTGDEEDKHYVFGFFFGVASATLISIGTFVAGAYIYTLVGLLLIAFGITSIIVHFKKLSSF